jgi:hypothetical protein
MQTARMVIQCTPSPGQPPATFLYSEKTGSGYKLVSPACPDCQALFAWIDANGWELQPYNPANPVGVYARTALPA